MSKATISRIKSIIFFVINIVLSILTMGLVLTLIGHVSKEETENIHLLLVMVIASILLYYAFLFIKYPNAKDRFRLIIVSILYCVAIVLALIAKKNYRFYFYSSFMIVLTTAIYQVLKNYICNIKKTKAEIFTNLILGLTLLLLSIAILLSIEEKEQYNITLIPALLFLIASMKNIIIPSLKFTKVKIFFDILIKTHTFDVIVCLLAMMITFSFLLPMYEETITSFWDALWYCFTVITTIGFGDFAATSVVGRILTVVLGIYGIVVVAILTSVIVSYYGTISKKEQSDEKYIE